MILLTWVVDMGLSSFLSPMFWIKAIGLLKSAERRMLEGKGRIKGRGCFMRIEQNRTQILGDDFDYRPPCKKRQILSDEAAGCSHWVQGEVPSALWIDGEKTTLKMVSWSSGGLFQIFGMDDG